MFRNIITPDTILEDLEKMSNTELLLKASSYNTQEPNKLALKKCDIHDSSIDAIVSLLIKKPEFTDLDLSYNQIKLISSVRKLLAVSSLKSIDLSFNQLATKDVETIKKDIQEMMNENGRSITVRLKDFAMTQSFLKKNVFTLSPTNRWGNTSDTQTTDASYGIKKIKTSAN